jgi:hypothetical protein
MFIHQNLRPIGSIFKQNYSFGFTKSPWSYDDEQVLNSIEVTLEVIEHSYDRQGCAIEIVKEIDRKFEY